MKTNLLFFVFLFHLNVFSAPVEKLNWSRSLQLLKEHNLDFKSAQATYNSVQELELSARSGYYPSLSGSLSYSQSKTEGSSDSVNPYSASLSVSQNLFAGLKDKSKLEQAQANTRVASATLKSSLAKISYDFISAYEGVVSAEESVQLAQNTVERRQRNLRMVELRFQGGRENKGSVLLSEAYLKQANYENLQAKHSLEAAQVTLFHFLGMTEASSELQLEPVPLKNSSAPPEFQFIAEKTPAVLEIQATYESNIAAVGIAKSAFMPNLSFTGSIGEIGPDFYPQKDRWSLGVNLTVPLFDGGKDYSAVQNAKWSRSASDFKKINVLNQTIDQLRMAYFKKEETIEKLKVDESFQKAAYMRAEIAKSQYNNGLISFVDWDNIENDLILRQKNVIQSKKDRVLNEAAWDQVRGEGVFDEFLK